jgi:hypothetical protein
MVLSRRRAAATDGGGTRNAGENGRGRDKKGDSTELASPLAPSPSSSASPALSPAWRILGLIFFAYAAVVSVHFSSKQSFGEREKRKDRESQGKT